MVEFEGRMTDDTIGLKQLRKLFDTAVRLTENGHESIVNGSQDSGPGAAPFLRKSSSTTVTSRITNTGSLSAASSKD